MSNLNRFATKKVEPGARKIFVQLKSESALMIGQLHDLCKASLLFRNATVNRGQLKLTESNSKLNFLKIKLIVLFIYFFLASQASILFSKKSMKLVFALFFLSFAVILLSGKSLIIYFLLNNNG